MDRAAYSERFGVNWSVADRRRAHYHCVGGDGLTGHLLADYIHPVQLASGTTDVASGDQCPNTGLLALPANLPRNMFLVINNQSGESISSVGPVGSFSGGVGGVGSGVLTGNTPIPNGNTGTLYACGQFEPARVP